MTIVTKPYDLMPKTRVGAVWPAKLLLATLAIPFFLPIGSLFLTADRLLLLIAFFPCLIMWCRGHAGPIHITDVTLILACLWMSLSMAIKDGLSNFIEPSGINFIETLGAYFVARCFVRDAKSFHAVVKFLFQMILLMLPFAIYETITSRNLLLEIANSIWPSYADVPKEPRWSLDRVALVFYHPILFGVFCGSCFSLSWYVLGYKGSPALRLLRTGAVGIATFLSLSSGPISALSAQIGLILYDILFHWHRNRWKILCFSVAVLWFLLEISASRSAFEIALTHFSFDPDTAWNRLRIWHFGKQSVIEHPLLGIGLTGDWVRPSWMTGSMDMFWLVPAVSHGLPAGLLVHFAFLSMCFSAASKRGIGARANAYRTGFLICMVSFYLAGWTVHYWKVIYVLFNFLLGCGAWIVYANSTTLVETQGDQTEKRRAVKPVFRRLFETRTHSARPETQKEAQPPSYTRFLPTSRTPGACNHVSNYKRRSHGVSAGENNGYDPQTTSSEND